MKLISQLAVVIVSLGAVTAQAQEPNFPHLVTSGYGEVVAKPDMAQFSVKVTETTMNAEQAKAAVDKVVAAFTTQLKSSGVSAQQISSSISIWRRNTIILNQVSRNWSVIVRRAV